MKRSAPTDDKNIEYVNFYFKPLKNDEERYKCKCGKLRKQAKKTGYTNLMDHIRTQHKDYVDVVKNQKKNGQLDLAGFTPSEAATQVFGWLDLILTEGYAHFLFHISIYVIFVNFILSWLIISYFLRLPFSTCTKPIYRRYVDLKPISLNTLMKYMKLLTEAVEKKIAGMLPEKYPLIFDGWTLDGASTHYIAIYARWLSTKNGMEKEKNSEERKRNVFLFLSSYQSPSWLFTSPNRRFLY